MAAPLWLKSSGIAFDHSKTISQYHRNPPFTHKQGIVYAFTTCVVTKIGVGNRNASSFVCAEPKGTRGAVHFGPFLGSFVADTGRKSLENPRKVLFFEVTGVDEERSADVPVRRMAAFLGCPIF
nr:hypothetical protein Iba_chr15cCG5390 [Ipomoea batatas]